MLQNKIAVIYAAGGSVAGVVAKTFAAAGATVFLTGRTLAPIKKLADEIIAAGGKAHVAQVDAMDEQAVAHHLHTVLQQVNKIDISFNLIDLQVVQNKPLTELTVNEFVTPVNIAMQSHFITATGAARIMQKQGSGVILTLTATPGGIGYRNTAGFAPAGELGIYGIRVVNIRSAGSPDSKVFTDAVIANSEIMKVVLHQIKDDTMLKKLPLMADIANIATFLASDLARSITGVTVDVTCGTTAGLNYKTTKTGI